MSSKPVNFEKIKEANARWIRAYGALDNYNMPENVIDEFDTVLAARAAYPTMDNYFTTSTYNQNLPSYIRSGSGGHGGKIMGNAMSGYRTNLTGLDDITPRFPRKNVTMVQFDNSFMGMSESALATMFLVGVGALLFLI